IPAILRAFRIPTFAMLSRMESRRACSASTSEKTRTRRPAHSAWRPSKLSDEGSQASMNNIRTPSGIVYCPGWYADRFLPSRQEYRTDLSDVGGPSHDPNVGTYLVKEWMLHSGLGQ